MHHGSKRCIDLHRYIFALEANWVTHLVAINMNTDECRVDELYFHILIARLESDLPLRLDGSSVLHLLDDEFHLGLI